MPRPCHVTHPVPEPDVCLLCKRWLFDPRFQALWGPTPAAPLRVVHAGMALVRAGAENQLESLVKFMGPSRAVITKCLVGNSSGGPLFDPDMAAQFAAYGTLAQVVRSREEAILAVKGADVLLCWGGPFGDWLKGHRPPVVVFVAHGEGDWTRKQLHSCEGLADHVVCVGERVKVAMAPHTRLPMTVIPNGIDRGRVAPTRSRQEVRAELGLAEDDFALLYVGRFSDEKRPHAILDALAHLPEDYKAVLLGWGASRLALHQRAERDFPWRATFPGATPFVGDYYQAADLLVSCASEEGLSLVLLEAMFAGLPIVCTPVGSVPEMVAAGARFAVCDGSGEAIARIVKSMKRCPDDVDGMVGANRAYAEAHGYARQMASRYADLFEALWVARPVPPEPSRGPLCQHWGPPTGRTATGCRACPVHACALHGEVTLRPTKEGLFSCATCTDGAPRDGPVPREVKVHVKRGGEESPPSLPPRSEALRGEVLVRFDQTTLWPGYPGLRFNPSILEDGEGYLFAYRTGWKGSEIYLGRLDAGLLPLGEPWRLRLRHQAAAYGREDPRLFRHAGRVHVSFTGVVGHRRGGVMTNVLLARLTEGLQVEQVYAPRYEKRLGWEKNWSPFSFDGALYAVYSIAPHRILRIDGDRAEMTYDTPTPAPWAPGTEMRGGASPVRVGDEYFAFFHSRREEAGRRTYLTGLYTFEAAPPFRVTRIIPEPIMTADWATVPPGQYAAVVFVGGTVRYKDGWALACGVHDRYCELHHFRHDDLERRLVEIGPPAGWRSLVEPHDGDVYREVVVRNEYRLPERFAPDDVVLDVGGHVGCFARAALLRGAGRVVSVEPFPERAAVLHENMERLHPGKHGTIALACWGNDPGDVAAQVGLPGVNVVRFDDLVGDLAARSASGRVRLVKLDCEGAEWAILPGSRALGRIDEIVGEYHLERPVSGGSVEALRGALEGAGFTVEIRPHPSGTGWEGGLFYARRA